MNKKLLLLSAFLAGASWTVLAQDLVLSEGQYYTDETQTTPYTGRYTEFYEDGMLKMELYLKDGSTVSLQSTMDGVYPFLDTAFAGWCLQTGRDPESCDFHDPSKSLWFPPVEES